MLVQMGRNGPDLRESRCLQSQAGKTRFKQLIVMVMSVGSSRRLACAAEQLERELELELATDQGSFSRLSDIPAAS